MVTGISIVQQPAGEWLLTYVRSGRLYNRRFVFFSDLSAYVEHELLGG